MGYGIWGYGEDLVCCRIDASTGQYTSLQSIEQSDQRQRHMPVPIPVSDPVPVPVLSLREDSGVLPGRQEPPPESASSGVKGWIPPDIHLEYYLCQINEARRFHLLGCPDNVTQSLTSDQLGSLSLCPPIFATLRRLASRHRYAQPLAWPHEGHRRNANQRSPPPHVSEPALGCP